MQNHKNIKGTAIVVALFIVSIIAVAVTTFFYLFQSSVKSVSQQIKEAQFQAVGEAAVLWAKGEIIAQNKKNAPGSPLNYPIVPPYPKMFTQKISHPIKATVSATLMDASAGINLNGLTDSMRRHVLEQLFIVEGVALSFPIKALVNKINLLTQVSIAKEKKFIPLISPLQVRKLIGFTQYQKIAKYLTALNKVDAKINLNTASFSVLRALGGEGFAQKLIVYRKTHHLNSDEQIASLMGQLGRADLQSLVTTNSLDFVETIHVKGGGQVFNKVVFLSVKENENSKVQVQWEYRGKYS
jgi:general secretion pathway protein K